MTRTVAVLGSSGSIGTQTLEIVRAEPDRYRVAALGVASSVDTLAAQAAEFRPEIVAVADRSGAERLRGRLPAGTELLAGPDAMAAAATCAQTVVNGVVGFAGLPVTLAALQAGKRLCLANKESLIAAGPVVQRAWATEGAELIPVDSEHCAIHQCLRASDISGRVGESDRVSELVLTASGGPFRGRTRQQLEGVTIQDALSHPTWSMGPKITVDSSTLMNKGLEVIEAHELFGVAYQQIRVVIHPQSIVHSMVTYTDGATLAQLSLPDMRLCIAYALAFPDRTVRPYGAVDWAESSQLEFHPPDLDAFRCLGLAYEAGRAAETAPAWLSAANEVAVSAFLAEAIRWVDIADVVEATMQQWPGDRATDVDAVLNIDRRAREVARRLVRSLTDG